MTPGAVSVLVAAAVVFLGVLVALSLRAPPEYGADEIASDPLDPGVTTIARRGLVTTHFYREGVRVARAEIFGQGDRGIVLRLEDDTREMLLTSVADWFETTRFGLKPGARLHLLVDGEPVAEALRLEPPSWREVLSGKTSMPRAFDVETAQGHFELAQLAYAKYALLQGDRVVGIVAMPLLSGLANRSKSRIELPGSLPLETHVFLAMLVVLDD